MTARGFDSAHIEGAADLVHHEGCEGFAFDLFSDNEEGLAALGDGLQQREHFLQVADLLFVDENVSVFENDFLALGVGYEIGGQVALVELHAFNDFEGGFDGLGLFDGDGAVLADLVHGVSDDLADSGVPVGRDGGDLANLFAIVDLLGYAGEFGNSGLNGLVDATLEINRVGTGGDVLQAFAIDAFGEHGGGGGAVASGVRGLGSNFLNHLGAHVLVGIWKFDFLGNGHAVLGDGRGTEFFVDNDVTALGSKGDLDGAGQKFDATEDFLTSILVEDELFSSHCD